LQELNRLQETLADELKNPLACIKGLTGLMRLEPVDLAQRLEVVQAEVRRMERVLDEHLSFVRPLTPLVAEATDLGAMVATVARLHEGMAWQKQVRLDITQAQRVELHADRHKLRQMLVNLVLNAVEASPPGATVGVMVRREGGRARIAVLDRGPGLNAELLARACEAGVTTKDERAGLGLTIVRMLAEQHGGALRLRNRDGGGLVAEVELPLG
jgi:signal transduction histidine kinase